MKQGYDGQNVAVIYTKNKDAKTAVQKWYKEYEDYKNNPGVYTGDSAHFTQVRQMTSLFASSLNWYYFADGLERK